LQVLSIFVSEGSNEHTQHHADITKQYTCTTAHIIKPLQTEVLQCNYANLINFDTASTSTTEYKLQVLRTIINFSCLVTGHWSNMSWH